MAFDKIVDSAKLEAGLKQICNAVREKGGTSAQLAFPDAIAQAIAAIEAGGGGAGPFSKVTTMKWTPAENVAKSPGQPNTTYKVAMGVIYSNQRRTGAKEIVMGLGFSNIGGVVHEEFSSQSVIKLADTIPKNYGFISSGAFGISYPGAQEYFFKAGVEYTILWFEV